MRSASTTCGSFDTVAYGPSASTSPRASTVMVSDRSATTRSNRTSAWAGGTTRDDQVPLSRVAASAVMRGMSGAPVLTRQPAQAGRMVLGVVSARYNSVDGWGRDSVWVARTENLAPLSPLFRTYSVGISAAGFKQETPKEIAAGWVQDDWTMTSRLTLNMGLRYDISKGQFAERVGILPWVAAGRPIQKNRFGPRVGFAYDLFGDGKTSLRSGAGIFYDSRQTGIFNNRFADVTPFSPQLTFTDPKGSFSNPPRRGRNPPPAGRRSSSLDGSKRRSSATATSSVRWRSSGES